MTRNNHTSNRGDAQLHQFLFWTSVATAVTAIVYGIAGIISAQPKLLMLLAGTIILLVVFLLAIRLNRSARVTEAVYTTCGSIAGYIVLATLAVPEMLPALALAPTLITAIALPYLDRRVLRAMIVGAILLAITVTLLSQYMQLFAPITADILSLLIVLFVTIVTGIILLLFWQNDARLKTTLQQSEETNRELRTLQAGLETKVVERTRELRQALIDLEERANEQARMRKALEQQREVILGLSVPVLPVTDAILVIPLVGALDQRRLDDVQQRALKAIEQSDAQTLLIDITGVPVVDNQVAKGLISVVQATRLLGARAVLVGIRPEVAQALVEAGIDLRSIQTFATLQGALGGMLDRSGARSSSAAYDNARIRTGQNKPMLHENV